MIRIALISTLLLGCSQHELVTEIAYSLDQNCEMKRPAIESNAIPRAADLWADFGVEIVKDSESLPGAHHVSICFTSHVDYDAPEGTRAIGRVWRDEDGSKMQIERGMSYDTTTATLAHEFAHIVTWNDDHSDELGIFWYSGGGQAVAWTDGDIRFFEDLGLEYQPMGSQENSPRSPEESGN